MNYEFIERFIFEKEKDTPFRNKETFYIIMKEKYRIKATRDLYAKIINYQVDKYGESLANSKLVEIHKREDCVRLSINANVRRKRKLKGNERKDEIKGKVWSLASCIPSYLLGKEHDVSRALALAQEHPPPDPTPSSLTLAG